MSGDLRHPLPRATWSDLLARLLGALSRRGARLHPADRAWVSFLLTPAELELWSRQSAHDQRHTIRVARRVEARLASTPYSGDPLWPAVALMHDVGKREADLNLIERVGATLAARVISVDRARRWMEARRRMQRRVAVYLLHGEVGAAMIRRSGGREAIAAWTEVHQGYGEMEKPGFPPVVVEALIESDAA